MGVLSSKSEGFANAILECMAAGLPVVATDVGGVREAIIEGETGHIVPSGDDKMMAERIIQVLANDENARMMGIVANRLRLRNSQKIAICKILWNSTMNY